MRQQRDRMPNLGVLLQMDGSHHRWNGKDEWCLIAAIDDATSCIPYAEFFDGETTLNCMKFIQKIIEKCGIPQLLYVDTAGLLRDASVIRNKLPELKLLLKNSISPERVFISDVEYLPAGESSKYPSLRISFRQPLSCLSTRTVEEHITVTTNPWLKSIVVL